PLVGALFAGRKRGNHKGCPYDARSRVRSAQHAERVHVGLEDRLLLLALVDVLLAQADDVAQRLGVEGVGLGCRIDVAHVIGERLLLLLEALDALDEGLQMILGKTGRVFLDGGGGGHRALLAWTRKDARRFPRTGPRGQAAMPVIHRSAQATDKENSEEIFSCLRYPRALELLDAAGAPPRHINACAPPWQTPPAARAMRPSGVWPATRRRACRRPPRGSRPCSWPGPWRRPLPSSSWTGSCGRSRRDSSGRCSARRCARAGARPGGGTRRPRAQCGFFRRYPWRKSCVISRKI